EADGRACGEGFGIVYLEAAQAGRASIGCKVGGQSDLIVDGSTGWLIEPDPSELAELLLRLTNKPEDLVAAGEQAQQRALAHFSQASFDQALAGALRSC
ncbi:MAG: glycosyltransferase, partial [Vulcanococcus sp.]